MESAQWNESRASFRENGQTLCPNHLPVVNLVSNYLQVRILKGTPGAENSNLHSQTELKVGRRRP